MVSGKYDVKIVWERDWKSTLRCSLIVICNECRNLPFCFQRGETNFIMQKNTSNIPIKEFLYLSGH